MENNVGLLVWKKEMSWGFDFSQWGKRISYNHIIGSAFKTKIQTKRTTVQYIHPTLTQTLRDKHMHWPGGKRQMDAHRSRVAQLAECRAEKPGAILTQAQFPSAARDFSPRVNCQCWPSDSVYTAPLCNRMHQHLGAHWKSQTLAATPLPGHAKHCKHW